MRNFLVVLILFAASGCASVDPVLSNLTSSPGGAAKTLILANTISVETQPKDRARVFKFLHFDILPGKYVASRSNAHGTLYIGEQLSVLERFQIHDQPLSFVSRGGIWLPSTPGVAPRIVISRHEKAKVEDPARLLASVKPGGESYSDASFARVPASVRQPMGPMGGNLAPLQAGAASVLAGALIDVIESSKEQVEFVFVGSAISDPIVIKEIETLVHAGEKL